MTVTQLPDNVNKSSWDYQHQQRQRIFFKSHCVSGWLVIQQKLTGIAPQEAEFWPKKVWLPWRCAAETLFESVCYEECTQPTRSTFAISGICCSIQVDAMLTPGSSSQWLNKAGVFGAPCWSGWDFLRVALQSEGLATKFSLHPFTDIRSVSRSKGFSQPPLCPLSLYFHWLLFITPWKLPLRKSELKQGTEEF